MKKRVLVINDHSDISKIVTETLCATGCQVRTSDKIDDTLELVENFRPDVVLLDDVAEDKNSSGICSIIKENAETRHIPVVIVSGNPQILYSFRRNKPDMILTKPFDADKLMSKVYYLLINTHFSGSL